MGFYRTSRCLEASIIDEIKAQLLAENWTNVAVEKTFARAYSMQLDENKNSAVICVRASDTNRKKVEIGTDKLVRSELVLLDVFATSDGQRLDLVDFIIDKLKSGVPYFEYETNKSTIINKTQNGRIRFLNIEDKPVNFNTDKSNLEVQDRYRHLISLTCSLGKVE